MEERVLSPKELAKDFFNVVEPQTSYRYAVLPYVKGLTELLERILKPYDIRVATKPLRTLQQLFPSPKDRPPPVSETNVVYKIDCSNCSWSYIGETGRGFNTRQKEHIRNVKFDKSGSNIANHTWANDHKIDFDGGKIIDRGTHRHRQTLKSWDTARTKGSDNNSKHLPEQYRFLINKH